MEYIKLSLEAILEVKEKFKSDHIAQILSGKASSAVKAYQHHKLDIFGEGQEKDEKFWGTVIRQGLIGRLISKDIENYGLLKLTKAGHDYIKDPQSFMISQDHDYDSRHDTVQHLKEAVEGLTRNCLISLKISGKKLLKNITSLPSLYFRTLHSRIWPLSIRLHLKNCRIVWESELEKLSVTGRTLSNLLKSMWMKKK
jgi:ATP-dependent DNA helicase RecQ